MRIVGIILAGGAGRRMGGKDKAQILLGGRTLAQHVAARVAPQLEALAIVARAGGLPHAPYGLPVLADGVPGQQGPLAGVLAGLDWAAAMRAEAVLSVSVDTPFLPHDLLARLQSALGDAPAAIAWAGGRRHPTCALWRVALRGPLRAALENGLRKVDGFATDIGAAEAVFPSADAFFNINTPENLHEAKAHLAARETAQFDRVVMIDWSARSAPSPRKPSADAIWLAQTDRAGTRTSYHRTRAEAEHVLDALLRDAHRAQERVLAGFDFPLGYPAGFAGKVAGTAGAPAFWEWLEERISDAPDNSNNRFEIARHLNTLFEFPGPFWGRPAHLQLPGLSDRKDADYGKGLAERRRVETLMRRTQPVWKLYTTGSVGSQALLGLPMIARLRRRFGAAVWPFDAPSAEIVFAEIYPSILDQAVSATLTPESIKDEVQVRLLSQSFWEMQVTGELQHAFAAVPDWPGRGDEGWILGVGAETALRAYAARSSPLPRNNASTPGMRPRNAV